MLKIFITGSFVILISKKYHSHISNMFNSMSSKCSLTYAVSHKKLQNKLFGVGFIMQRKTSTVIAIVWNT